MEDEKKLLQVENEKENTKVGASADSLNDLQLGEFISAPLIAISDAQHQLAEIPLDFLKKFAYEDNGKKSCPKIDLEHAQLQCRASIEVQEPQPECLSKLKDIMASHIESLDTKE